MILAHNIGLKPNQMQNEYFYRASGVACMTFNWALAEWISQYEAGGKPTAFSLKKEFNAIKVDQWFLF